MSRTTLRQNIATEAARLVLQKQAQDLYAGRRQAARFFSRRRVTPDQLPTLSEIQEQVLSLSGLFRRERQVSLLLDLRMAAAELMRTLATFPSLVAGDPLRDQVLPGAEITLHVQAEQLQIIADMLLESGLRYLHTTPETKASKYLRGTIHGVWRYPCTLTLQSPDAPIWQEQDFSEFADLASLERLIALDTPTLVEREVILSSTGEETSYHPEFPSLIRMYLQGLEAVKLDSCRHPEGDLLYHSLQVFELGRNQQPYDEEFLLACLIHDVGWGLDRRHPHRALMQVMEGLLSSRTTFLLEHHPEGVEYFKTGKIRPSLRKSEHFDDLLLLARCDIEGRVCGALVPNLDDALDYILHLESAWEDLLTSASSGSASQKTRE